jgi:hypothetical protein
LVIRQAQSSPAKLFTKDPVFLAQVLDHLELLLIHPAGDRDQHEPEGIKNFGHLIHCREPLVCTPELA